MNELLHAGFPDNRQIGKMFEELRGRFKPVIRFIDFEYYNEKTLLWAQERKVDALKAENYEVAGECRDIEKKCLEYVEMIKRFGIRESAFHFEDNEILYLYFGNARNDKAFKKVFLKIFKALGKDKYY